MSGIPKLSKNAGQKTTRQVKEQNECTSIPRPFGFSKLLRPTKARARSVEPAQDDSKAQTTVTKRVSSLPVSTSTPVVHGVSRHASDGPGSVGLSSQRLSKGKLPTVKPQTNDNNPSKNAAAEKATTRIRTGPASISTGSRLESPIIIPARSSSLPVELTQSNGKRAVGDRAVIRPTTQHGPLLSSQTKGLIKQLAQPTSRRTSIVTASDLSEMYEECIGAHPHSYAAQNSLMPSNPYQKLVNGPSQHERSDSLPASTTDNAPAQFTVTSLSPASRNSSSSSSSPMFRNFFVRKLQQFGTKRAATEPTVRGLRISQPFPIDQPEQQRSMSLPYEKLDDNSEPPVLIRTIEDRRIIEPDPRHIEALPRMSTQLQTLSNSRICGTSAGGSLLLLKSLLKKNEAQAKLAFGWEGKKSAGVSGASGKVHAQDHPKSREQEIAEGKKVSKIIRDTRIPPPRPPRPDSLWSKPDEQILATGLPEIGQCKGREPQQRAPSFSSSCSEVSNNEVEEARRERHRRRAFYALDGVTHPHGDIRISKAPSLQASMPQKIRVAKALPNIAAVAAAEDEVSRQKKPLSFSSSSSSMVGISPYSPENTDQAIVSTYRDTRAWWEEEAFLDSGPLPLSEFSYEVDELQKCDSPTIKPRTIDGHYFALPSSNFDAGYATPTSEQEKKEGTESEIERETEQEPECRGQSLSSASNSVQPSPPLRSPNHGKKSLRDTIKTHRLRLSSLQKFTKPAPTSTSTNVKPFHVKIEHRSSTATSTFVPPVSLLRPASLPPAVTALAAEVQQNSPVHESFSDSSLEARATALRHGKQLKGMNEYEAAHAIEATPPTVLSQCSLGLSSAEKRELRPEPLHIVRECEHEKSPDTEQEPEQEHSSAYKQEDYEAEAEDDSFHNSFSLSSFNEPSSSLSTPCKTGERISVHVSTAPVQDAPPALPPRSKLRPRLGGDWSTGRMQALKLGILESAGEEGNDELQATYFQPCNLSTIMEESSRVSDADCTSPHRQRSEEAAEQALVSQEAAHADTSAPSPAPPDKISSRSASASTASTDNAHDTSWWSEALHLYAADAAAGDVPPLPSSKDTTPEKAGEWTPPKSTDPSTSERPSLESDEQDPLSYYLEASEHEMKRATAKERLRREQGRYGRRQEREWVKEERVRQWEDLIREAKGGKRRAVAGEEKGKDVGPEGSGVGRRGRMRQRVEEAEADYLEVDRIKRVRGILGTLREEEEDG